MIRTAVLLAASLLAAPLLAQDQFYIYVSYKDVKGASIRHKLKCVDVKCTADIGSAQRSVSLSEDQHREVLGALQAESRHFVVAADSASSDSLMKVKLRYEAPTKRLEIVRQLPDDKPADLAPELVQVIKAHLELDLSQPVSPKPTEHDEAGSEPATEGQNK